MNKIELNERETIIIIEGLREMKRLYERDVKLAACPILVGQSQINVIDNLISKLSNSEGKTDNKQSLEIKVTLDTLDVEDGLKRIDECLKDLGDKFKGISEAFM